MLLFHIAYSKEWQQSLENEIYGQLSIKNNKFIHCATFEQLIDVANNNLKYEKEDLVVLCIDSNGMKAEVKWERNKNNGIIFPHVYGLINTDCVIEAINFKRNQDGEFFISDELANFSEYEKSCGAVIFHRFNEKDKVLLINFLHDGESRWGFPKGHMEEGETEIQTAVREVMEEVGLNIKIFPNFRESTHFSIIPGLTRGIAYYCAEAVSTETVPREGEVEKTAWLGLEDAYRRLTYDCDKEVLVKLFNKYKLDSK